MKNDSTKWYTGDELSQFFYQSCEKCGVVSQIPDSLHRLNLGARPAFINSEYMRLGVPHQKCVCGNSMPLNGHNQAIADSQEEKISNHFRMDDLERNPPKPEPRMFS